MCCSEDSNPKREVLAGPPPSEAPDHQDKCCHTLACELTAGFSPPLVQLSRSDGVCWKAALRLRTLAASAEGSGLVPVTMCWLTAICDFGAADTMHMRAGKTFTHIEFKE